MNGRRTRRVRRLLRRTLLGEQMRTGREHPLAEAESGRAGGSGMFLGGGDLRMSISRLQGRTIAITVSITQAPTRQTLAFDSQPSTMMVIATFFSSFHNVSAATMRSAGAKSICLPIYPSMSASCAGLFAMRRPSCGVYTHQSTAKKTVHTVLRMWSAKNRCAKYSVCLASS